MSQSSQCALIGLGFVVGLMPPGTPGLATAVLPSAVDCIGLT